MAVEKLSISLEPGMRDEIRAAALDSDESVSAWLAEAARARLRQLALEHALGEILEAEALTPEDLDAADDLLADAFWTNPSKAKDPAPKKRRKRR